jgi:translation initiation factor 2 subunit 2
MSDYAELLEQAYEKMPKKTASKERFEAPRFVSMLQGSQTFINNFSEVADALRRDPKHLLKYVVKELATAGNCDGKRGILNGKFRDEQLNAKLDAYITEFVICKECKKPDTDLIVFEGIKYKRCEVCGARAPVKQV